jgi:hypothetical protein
MEPTAEGLTADKLGCMTFAKLREKGVDWHDIDHDFVLSD